MQRTDILENKEGTCWWSYMTHHRLVPGGGRLILNLLSGLPAGWWVGGWRSYPEKVSHQLSKDAPGSDDALLGSQITV